MRITSVISALAMTLVSGAASGQPSIYVIDPTHTFVTFEVTHFGTSTNRGRFDRKQGVVTLDGDGKNGKVELTLDTASINTGTAAFDEHLRNKDFFDVARFPEAKFVSEQFKLIGGTVRKVSGQLTLLGKTNPVTLKARRFNCYDNPIIAKPVCGGDFVTTIKRSEWGMTWGADIGVPDDVTLVIQVEAIKQ